MSVSWNVCLLSQEEKRKTGTTIAHAQIETVNWCIPAVWATIEVGKPFFLRASDVNIRQWM